MNPSVLCFRKLPIAKNFMDKRGEVSRFPVEVFWLAAQKVSVGVSLYFFTIVGYQKNLYFRGLCHDFRFPVEFFLSHSAEMFRR